jgi:hypothetical protein
VIFFEHIFFMFSLTINSESHLFFEILFRWMNSVYEEWFLSSKTNHIFFFNFTSNKKDTAFLLKICEDNNHSWWRFSKEESKKLSWIKMIFQKTWNLKWNNEFTFPLIDDK